MLDRVAGIEQRFEGIEQEMAKLEVISDPSRLQALAKERASLQETVTVARDLRRVDRELADAEAMLQESAEPELKALAQQEAESLRKSREDLAARLRVALLPRDPNDDRNVIVEVRAGVGGDEAGLWAADLYRMYTRLAQRHGWGVELMDASESTGGGFKEVVFEVRGQGAFSWLKHERGVHRVQRVPATEAQGRIHTSTAGVTVLPEVEDVDIRINPGELRIDIFHAGGHGGQNVNKVATAVRVVHIPTGVTAVCQDERSQLKNREKAMSVLRARLYEAEQRRRDEELSASRRSQVGSGDRAEKVRTYNFPQDRLTDHRINVSVHGLGRILDGDLDAIISQLQHEEQARLLTEATEAPAAPGR